ncbi:MAG: OmpA family protein [Pseudomonadota bacterium]
MFKTAFTAAAIFAVAVQGAAAQERTIVHEAPSAQEYIDYLFTQDAPIQIKTRGIRMTATATAAPQPAPAPAPKATAPQPRPVQPAAAPAQPQVIKASASPAPAAAALAPQPAKPRVLAAPVNFATDSAAIPADFVTHLVNLADAMKRPEAEGKLLVVTGHTDSRGDARYNLELSQRRAEAVEAFLIGRGVPRAQIIASGKGESVLIPGRETDHDVNRRVEFLVAG